MIKIKDNPKTFGMTKCSICGSDLDTKTIIFEHDINGSGTSICLCKQCRNKLKELIKKW